MEGEESFFKIRMFDGPKRTLKRQWKGKQTVIVQGIRDK